MYLLFCSVVLTESLPSLSVSLSLSFVYLCLCISVKLLAVYCYVCLSLFHSDSLSFSFSLSISFYLSLCLSLTLCLPLYLCLSLTPFLSLSISLRMTTGNCLCSVRTLWWACWTCAETQRRWRPYWMETYLRSWRRASTIALSSVESNWLSNMKSRRQVAQLGLFCCNVHDMCSLRAFPTICSA